MIDFSQWMEAWNTYNNPTKTVPLTAAEIHNLRFWSVVLCGVFVLGVLVFCVASCLADNSKSNLKSMALFGLACVASFALVTVYMFTVTTDTFKVDAPLPASFITQAERTFGVRNLSCPAEVMDAGSVLPDAGSYQCVVTSGESDSNLSDVTLVVAGHNVGLYDKDGKALVANGNSPRTVPDAS